MSRLQLRFEFTATEEEARAACERNNREATPYCRKRYPSTFTPWQSSSPTDAARFVVWYHQ